MKLKDILAKLAAGEELTDAEKAFLAEVDPDKAANDAAAAARRKAEERLKAAEDRALALEAKVKELTDAAEAQGDKGKSELEKAQKAIERLTAQIAERDNLIKTLQSERDGLTREQKLAAIVQKAGIAFIPGVNSTAMMKILKDEFAALDLKDLDDQAQTGPILSGFVKSNEAIIADTTGNGSGRKAADRVNTFQGKSVANPWKKETLNLTLQGQILTGDPELAKRMKREAGIAA